uniref:Glycosyltransferase n=1 Tax=Rhizophora mucronata TaxID=61149 RepID=A0A2P2P5J2_RHIMU
MGLIIKPANDLFVFAASVRPLITVAATLKIQDGSHRVDRRSFTIRKRTQRMGFQLRERVDHNTLALPEPCIVKKG